MSLDDDPIHRDIVRLAHDAHKRHWRMDDDVGLGDRLAVSILLRKINFGLICSKLRFLTLT
ncbi:MAG: hypothetical protein ACP5GF_13240 [Thiomonas sp.]